MLGMQSQIGPISHRPPPSRTSRPLMPIQRIADLLNDADAGIEALIGLLDQASSPIAPGGIAHLLRPHHQALRRAAEDLSDHS